MRCVVLNYENRTRHQWFTIFFSHTWSAVSILADSKFLFFLSRDQNTTRGDLVETHVFKRFHNFKFDIVKKNERFIS